MKTYTEKEVIDIIGGFDHESDGWDIFFDEECCPGDDIAEYRNHLRLQQYQRAGIKVSKSKFEKESGLVYKPLQ